MYLRIRILMEQGGFIMVRRFQKLGALTRLTALFAWVCCGALALPAPWGEASELPKHPSSHLASSLELDAETLRLFLGSLPGEAANLLDPVLAHLQGLQVDQAGEWLNIEINFEEAFTLFLRDVRGAPRWQPYAVYFPKVMTFSARMDHNQLEVQGLDAGEDGEAAWHLQVKVPMISDSVWIRKMSLDMTSGHLHVEAGVLGDGLTLVADAELAVKKFEGLELGETLRENLALLPHASQLFFRML